MAGPPGLGRLPRIFIRPLGGGDALPSLVVRRRGGVTSVSGAVRNGLYAPGALDLVPAAERLAQYEAVAPTLAWAGTFYNRLQAAALDGDAPWTDAQLLQALSLARSVAFVFQDPSGEEARRLVERARALAA